MSELPLLTLVMVIALSLVSMLAISRRNGSGSSAWERILSDVREERDMWRDLAIHRGEQLSRVGVTPVTLSEIETLSALARDIEKKFSMSEIDVLAFAIGINPESLQRDTVSELARELVMAANRRNRLEQLIAQMHKERPQE